MELDIQKKIVCKSGTKSEILSRDREAGSWLQRHMDKEWRIKQTL